MTGKGDYIYKNEGGEEAFVHFYEIGVKVDTVKKKQFSHKIFANGSIPDTSAFKIHPKIWYKGDVHLDSDSALLEFKGYAKLAVDTSFLQTGYFAMDQDIDPENFSIKYENPISDRGDTTVVGIVFNDRDSLAVQDLIFRRLRPSSARKIIEAKGQVVYDNSKREFKFGTPERISEETMIGPLIRLNEKEEYLKAEGPIDFNLDFDPITVTSSGSIHHDIKTNEYTFNIGLMGIDLQIDEELEVMMATDLVAAAADKNEINYNKPEFELALSNLFEDDKAAQKSITDLNTSGLFQRPKGFDHSLVITDLEMFYDSRFQIYRSRGDIGLSMVGETGIHKTVKGYVEFGFRRSGAFFKIYFEPNDYDWYFLSFRNQALELVSSNEDFIKLLGAIPVEERTVLIGDSKEAIASSYDGEVLEEFNIQEYYLYTVGTFKDRKRFVNRMQKFEIEDAGGEAVSMKPVKDTGPERSVADILREAEEAKMLLEMDKKKKGKGDGDDFYEEFEDDFLMEDSKKKKGKKDQGEFFDPINAAMQEKAAKDKKKNQQEEEFEFIDDELEEFGGKSKGKKKKGKNDFDDFFEEEPPVESDFINGPPPVEEKEEEVVEEPVEEVKEKSKGKKKKEEVIEEEPVEEIFEEPVEEVKEKSKGKKKKEEVIEEELVEEIFEEPVEEVKEKSKGKKKKEEVIEEVPVQEETPEEPKEDKKKSKKQKAVEEEDEIIDFDDFMEESDKKGKKKKGKGNDSLIDFD